MGRTGEEKAGMTRADNNVYVSPGTVNAGVAHLSSMPWASPIALSRHAAAGEALRNSRSRKSVQSARASSRSDASKAKFREEEQGTLTRSQPRQQAASPELDQYGNPVRRSLPSPTKPVDESTTYLGSSRHHTANPRQWKLRVGMENWRPVVSAPRAEGARLRRKGSSGSTKSRDAAGKAHGTGEILSFANAGSPNWLFTRGDVGRDVDTKTNLAQRDTVGEATAAAQAHYHALNRSFAVSRSAAPMTPALVRARATPGIIPRITPKVPPRPATAQSSYDQVRPPWACDEWSSCASSASRPRSRLSQSLKLSSRPVSAASAEPGAPKGVYKRNIDFLMKQLRDVCYAKVRGNGADISVREVFRHFDSDKEVGEDDAGEHGIDKKEFVQAVKRLMLGSAPRGIITTAEAVALFDRIDADKSGNIDYRETAAVLSVPGWDNTKLLSPHLGL